MRDSGASGAIGTEIPVYEDLAAEFASLFLRRFLAGKGTAGNGTAGIAMLESRLEMLGRLNPLGLAYTLYGFSNLAITQGAGYRLGQAEGAWAGGLRVVDASAMPTMPSANTNAATPF